MLRFEGGLQHLLHACVRVFMNSPHARNLRNLVAALV